MSQMTEVERPLRLGPDLTRRLRPPGPPLAGRGRSAPIGSIASSSTRFADSLARPAPTRQQLRGPQISGARSYRNADRAPLRWWKSAAPTPPAPSGPTPPPSGESSAPEQAPSRPAAAAPAVALPRRGLPRAVHRVPDGKSRTPGGVLDGLVSKPAPVRRLAEVVAVGPMLTSHDQAKLQASPVSRPPAGAAALRASSPSPDPPPPPPPPRRAEAKAPVSRWKPALPSQLDKAMQTSRKSANPFTARKRADALVLGQRPDASPRRVAESTALAGAVATRTRSNAFSQTHPVALRRGVEPEKPVRPALRISDFSTAAWLMPTWSLSAWGRKRAEAASAVAAPARPAPPSPPPVPPVATPLPAAPKPATPAAIIEPTAEPTADPGAAPTVGSPARKPIAGAHRAKPVDEPGEPDLDDLIESTPSEEEDPSSAPEKTEQPDPGARRLNYADWDDEVKSEPRAVKSSPFNWGTSLMSMFAAPKGGTFGRNGLFGRSRELDRPAGDSPVGSTRTGLQEASGRTASTWTRATPTGLTSAAAERSVAPSWQRAIPAAPAKSEEPVLAPTWKRATPSALAKTEEAETGARRRNHAASDDEVTRAPAKAKSSPFNWGTALTSMFAAPKGGTFGRNGLFGSRGTTDRTAEGSPVGKTRAGLQAASGRTTSSWKRATPTGLTKAVDREPAPTWKRATPSALAKTEEAETGARRLNHAASDDEVTRAPAKVKSSPFNLATASLSLLAAPKGGAFGKNGLFGKKGAADRTAEASPVGSTRDSLRESAERRSSSGMADLLTTGNRRRANAQSENMLLATAFGAAETVRPNAARPGAAQPPAETGSKKRGFFSRPTGPASRDDKTDHGRSGKAGVEDQPILGRARSNANAPAPLRPAPLLPAPPPVVINPPDPGTQPGAPPVPASASGRGLVPGPGGTLRRSLVDTTAALFAAKFGAAKAAATSVVDDMAGKMNGEQPEISRAEGASTATGTAPASALDDPRKMQELVDKVVERIETKVVDELERRGRRHNPGVF